MDSFLWHTSHWHCWQRSHFGGPLADCCWLWPRRSYRQGHFGSTESYWLYKHLIAAPSKSRLIVFAFGSDSVSDPLRSQADRNAIRFSPPLPDSGNAVKHFKQRKHWLRFNSRIGEVRVLASHFCRHGLFVFVALSGSGLSRPDTALVF